MTTYQPLDWVCREILAGAQVIQLLIIMCSEELVMTNVCKWARKLHGGFQAISKIRQ